MENAIVKRIEIKAPVSRVWRALTDHREFGEWFGVKIEGPFVVGQRSTGTKNNTTGCGGRPFGAVIEKIEPEKRFSYRWQPYSGDPNKDIFEGPLNLVEFVLEPTKTGTLLTVTESGFANLPVDRHTEAFPKHYAGWEAQAGNVTNYVAQNP